MPLAADGFESLVLWDLRPSGILLPRLRHNVEYVYYARVVSPDVRTSGATLRACDVRAGPCTKIGMLAVRLNQKAIVLNRN